MPERLKVVTGEMRVRDRFIFAYADVDIPEGAWMKLNDREIVDLFFLPAALHLVQQLRKAYDDPCG